MQKIITKIEHPQKFHMVWDGFRVAQYIPGYGREMSNDTSPFLMLDYNAPWKLEPQNGHRPWVGFHPHRGFETVTIVYSGEIEHQDSAWNGGVIGANEVQWMTAGSGLLHNEFMTERFSAMGWVQHAVQLWVNLPKIHKMIEPRYQALTRENIPEVLFDGGKVRVIAWELHFSDSSSRVKWSETKWNVAIQIPETLDCFVPRNDGIIWAAKTFSPVELYDVRFDSHSNITISLPGGFNAMVLVVEWSIIANEKLLQNGDMVFLSQAWEDIDILSDDNAKVLIMAGEPLDEEVAAYGPFVMNTEAEIRQAFEDFRNGKMWIISKE